MPPAVMQFSFVKNLQTVTGSDLLEYSLAWQLNIQENTGKNQSIQFWEQQENYVITTNIYVEYEMYTLQCCESFIKVYKNL